MKDLIKDLPLAQKRTSNSKKYVYICEDYVYKGPFQPTEKSYILSKLFLEQLKRLEKVLDVPIRMQSHVDIINEVKTNEGIFLQYENVGNLVDEKHVHVVSTKIDENIHVVDRNTFVSRVSDLEKAGTMIDEFAIATLQHLYLLYLLGVGDVGPHNILIRKKGSQNLIAGIDLECVRPDASGKTNLVALLLSKPSKAQIEYYSKYIHHFGGTIKICTDEENLRGLDESIRPGAIFRMHRFLDILNATLQTLHR
jgi:hypothetical protein